MSYFVLNSVTSPLIHIRYLRLPIDPTTRVGYSERLSVALRVNCSQQAGVRYSHGYLK